MEKSFAAVRSGNPDDWLAIQLPEGTSLSFRPGPDGQREELEFRIANNEDSIADLAKVDGEWKLVNFMWTVEYEGCPTAPE